MSRLARVVVVGMRGQLPHLLLTWLAEQRHVQIQARLRANTYMGRPCGAEGFVALFEKVLGRLLAPQKVGRKPKAVAEESSSPSLPGLLGEK